MKKIQENICFICGQEGKSLRIIRRHIRDQHKGVNFNAGARKNKKNVFLSSDQNSGDLGCTKGCNAKFSSLSSRDLHHLNYHKEFNFKCTWVGCSKTFTRIDLYRKHLELPHNPRPSSFKPNIFKKVIIFEDFEEKEI
jgi:hypothetical protein